jgi:hypothetical protein
LIINHNITCYTFSQNPNEIDVSAHFFGKLG